ncbi:MAG: arsenate reductase family protein [Bacteroidota bacterium]
MIIYYNPDCSKCNEVRDLLSANNCSVEIREYLKDPPTAEELKTLLKKLGCAAFDIVRKSEPLFAEQFQDKQLSEAQWITVLCENPVLIERPIVINGETAIVGRPPSMVLQLIQDADSK